MDSLASFAKKSAYLSEEKEDHFRNSDTNAITLEHQHRDVLLCDLVKSD